ncbi:MAG: amidohydrolase family protein [Desulfobacteraceae bacterium]|nr:amidohydrolase family protein [Desulfobacteraceae bacterium]
MRDRHAFTVGGFLLGLLVVTLVLAWATYGTLAGALGTLTYLLVGLLGLFPWIIPFVGIPLGILDLLGVFGVGVYDATLRIARLDSSWLPVMWYTVVAILASVVGLVVSVRAFQRIFRKRARPKNLALINCRIIAGDRDGQVIEDGVILIKNVVADDEMPGRIAAVGHAGEVTVPADYEKLDLGGQYVLPGFINAHCHLVGSGKPMKLFRLASENEKLASKVIGLLTTSLGKRMVLRMMTANARSALHSGVTTLRSMADLVYLDVKLRKKIERGEVIGPRLLVAGQAIVPTGGHGGFLGVAADSATEIKRLVRTNLREGVDWLKIISTGGVLDARQVGEAGQPQMTVEEIEAACTCAHRGGIMVATHCESTIGIEEALLGGVDTIEHGAEITDELVPLFKRNPRTLRGYTALVPTIAATMGIATLPIETTKISQMSLENAQIVARQMIRGLQRAYKEGILIAMGTDASVPYSAHYEFWKELKYYLHYTDMMPQEAIFFATKGSAQVLGIEKETGSIEVGKSADLQVVAGNPLEDIDCLGEVTRVVIRGFLIDELRVKRIKALDKTPVTKMLELSED